MAPVTPAAQAEPVAAQPAYRQADALAARSAQFRPRSPAPATAPEPVTEPLAPPRAAAPVEAPPEARAPDIQHEPPFVPREPIAPEPALLERRAGQVGTWTAFALGLALLGGAAYWYDRESKIEDTMAIVANSSSPIPSAARASAAPPPVVEDPVAAPPPMVMLQDRPAVPAPAEQVTEAAVPAPEPQRAAEPTAAPAPVAKAPEKKSAPKKPVEAEREPDKPAARPAAKPRRTQVAAKDADDAPPKAAKPRPKPATPAPKPAAPPAEPKLSREQRWEETLRLCRAAGYHAAQCVERQCTATRYGLACRG